MTPRSTSRGSRPKAACWPSGGSACRRASGSPSHATRRRTTSSEPGRAVPPSRDLKRVLSLGPWRRHGAGVAGLVMGPCAAPARPTPNGSASGCKCLARDSEPCPGRLPGAPEPRGPQADGCDAWAPPFLRVLPRPLGEQGPPTRSHAVALETLDRRLASPGGNDLGPHQSQRAPWQQPRRDPLTPPQSRRRQTPIQDLGTPPC